jgi:DNA-binding NarL/FixJ family response regulator
LTDAAPRHRVMLCDDAADFVRLLQLLLELEPDFEVVGSAHDGATAIELVAELTPDLLVLDVSMPIMDGLSALPQLRTASPATRIVMLSGFSSDDLRRRALELGAVGCLEKGESALDLPIRLRAFCA